MAEQKITKRKAKQITISMDPTRIAKMKQYAAENNLTLSEVIRRWVDTLDVKDDGYHQMSLNDYRIK
jgi:hypothetical protein